MLSAATAQRTTPAPRRVVAAVRALELLVFAGLPLGCAVLFAYFQLKAPSGVLFDFRTFWESGRAVLHGHSPYPASLPTTATGSSFRPFVYPAPAAVLVIPLALLPWAVACVLWLLLSIGAVFAAIRLLGVRDWRCYGAAFVWPGVWSATVNGSATLLMLLGCVALWRLRARPYSAGAVVALLVVFKLYLWPLALWLLATRRFRATFASFVFTVAAGIGGWALIGFAGLANYPQLLSRLTTVVARESYSPYAFARSIGATPGEAEIAMLLLGASLLVLVVRQARRPAGEAAAFGLAVAASLALTPIVWPHYFALLIVLVALAAPALDAAWLLPIPAWFVSTAWSEGSALRIAVSLCIYGLVVVWSVRRLAGARSRFVIAPPVLYAPSSRAPAMPKSLA